MHRTIALVLAGGEGRRLAPLTYERSKPAVHFGGQYRLVDFVLSNLVNSGVRHIKVITQYRATSLNRHLARAWPSSTHVPGVEIDLVPAAMNLGPTWYRGTADAVWQNLDVLREHRPDDTLVFASDHIYKMDVSQLVAHHRDLRADVTVGVVSVPRAHAREFGCVAVDSHGRVVDFMEKPVHPPEIPGRPGWTLVSMGNYVFRTPALLDELKRCMGRPAAGYDFGKDILTSAHRRRPVHAYALDSQLCPGEAEGARGYWRDVGTLDSYFEASMDLVTAEPRLDLYNDQWPIRGSHVGYGPAHLDFGGVDGSTRVRSTLVGAGAVLSGDRIERVICSHHVRICPGAVVEDAILFPNVEIGAGARISHCIVDSGVRIPPGTVIGEDAAFDDSRFPTSPAGVVVVTRANLGQIDEFDVSAEGSRSSRPPPPSREEEAQDDLLHG
jgi:glucose-1-phosphate adenylyltransferase